MKQHSGQQESLAEFSTRLSMLASDYHIRRENYLDYVKSISGLPSTERALAWLRFVAKRNESYGEQEALIFLLSRGIECSKELDQLGRVFKSDGTKPRAQ